MAAARVQKATTSDFNTTLTRTITAATAGNLLIAFANIQTGSATLNGPSGYTAHPATPITTVGAPARSGLWYKVATGGETSVTVTTSSNAFITLEVVEISGVSTTPEDTDSIASVGANTAAVAPAVTTAGNAYIFVGVAWSDNLSTGTSWTNSFITSSTVGTQQISADRIVAGAASYTTTATWTNAANWGLHIIAFAESGGGGPDVTAPLVISRSVTGSTLTVNYDEALSTNPAHIPPASAWTCTVNGVARTITNVGVSGSTVTLTLATPVTTGQTVLLSYVP